MSTLSLTAFSPSHITSNHQLSPAWLFYISPFNPHHIDRLLTPSFLNWTKAASEQGHLYLFNPLPPWLPERFFKNHIRLLPV